MTSRSASAVVVVHPGTQHSRELARALHQGGLLSRFVTSINGSAYGATWLSRRIRDRLRARVIEGVSGRQVITIPYVEAAMFLVGPFLSARLKRRLIYAGLALFDRLASTRAVAGNPRVVVGFENSCRHTFRKAKSAGALCVLDAASVHHSAQPAQNADMDTALTARITKAKDEEILLADHVIVLSTYARDTYAAAGVPAGKISVIPPGAWVPGFAGESVSCERQAGIRFLFVGNVKHAKGIDLLLGAFSRLDFTGKKLMIVGAMAEPRALPEPLPVGVEYLGKLDRNALFGVYARSDVLVSPSRADGFGLVVAEAMSAGLPVIVSSATGAKDLVEDGLTGWIYPTENEAALLGALENAVSRKDDLRAMGARARQSLTGATWAVYGEQTRALYRRLLTESENGRVNNQAAQLSKFR